MKETLKNQTRRTNNGDFSKFFHGNGLDIGAGSCPVLPGVTVYDKSPSTSATARGYTTIAGDATNLFEIPDESFDFVHSSHCLEHMDWPAMALFNWWRVLKPGGHLIVVVPDEALYEKYTLPSRFNSDHKHLFSMEKLASLARGLRYAQIIRIQVNDEGFNYEDFESDQTMKGAQAEIEMIVRKHKFGWWTR